MNEWYELYDLQHSNLWRPDCFTNDKQWNSLKKFDQTTLWYMVNRMDKYKDLKIGFFHDDIRWNYFTQYQYENLKSIENKPVILRHYSGCLEKDKALV